MLDRAYNTRSLATFVLYFCYKSKMAYKRKKVKEGKEPLVTDGLRSACHRTSQVGWKSSCRHIFFFSFKMVQQSTPGLVKLFLLTSKK
jgi:hypothetical protein